MLDLPRAVCMRACAAPFKTVPGPARRPLTRAARRRYLPFATIDLSHLAQL